MKILFFFYTFSCISNLKLCFWPRVTGKTFERAVIVPHHIQSTSYINWTPQPHFPQCHVRPASEYFPTVEHNRGQLSSSWPLKWPDEGRGGGEEVGGRGVKTMEGKLGPRSRKLICFLRPLLSLGGGPHTAHARGALMWLRVHSMLLISSATGSHLTEEQTGFLLEM